MCVDCGTLNTSKYLCSGRFFCYYILHDIFLLQTAVGLLATMAVVHFTITIILGVLVAFVLHLRKRSKVLKLRQQAAETTRGTLTCYMCTYAYYVHACTVRKILNS